MSDDPALTKVRRQLIEAMESVNRPIIKNLHDTLTNVINTLNNSERYDMPSVRFNFQGTSIEIESVKRGQGGFLKRLFSFR